MYQNFGDELFLTTAFIITLTHFTHNTNAHATNYHNHQITEGPLFKKTVNPCDQRIGESDA